MRPGRSKAELSRDIKSREVTVWLHGDEAEHFSVIQALTSAESGHLDHLLFVWNLFDLNEYIVESSVGAHDKLLHRVH